MMKCLVILLLACIAFAESMLLEGNQLRVEQYPDAVWDEDSKQWMIRLTCGSFTFQGPPPLNVTWTTPQGEARFSSGYDSGRFFLHLNTPVQGGNYSCAVPGQSAGSNISGSVSVDAVKARLTLLEANQNTLEESLQELAQRHASDMESLNQLCLGVEASLEEQEEMLNDIQQALNKSQEAVLTGACRDGMYSILDDDWRSTSYELEGYDYQCDSDLPHGWYRFYLHGKDAVMPTHCVPDHHCRTHAPQWLDMQGQSLPAPGEEKEARACANWSDDCCNWESPVTVRNCGNFFVYNLQPRSTCQLAYCSEPL